MSIQSILSSVPQEVTLNQPYNERVNSNDVPPECTLHQRSLDDKPIETWNDESDHEDYQHLLDRLYTQGLKACAGRS